MNEQAAGADSSALDSGQRHAPAGASGLSARHAGTHGVMSDTYPLSHFLEQPGLAIQGV